MRPALIAGILVLFAMPVAAHGDAHDGDQGAAAANISVDSLLDHPDTLASTYNDNSQAVPGIILSLVADERVNVHVSTSEGNVTIGAVMDGTRITAVQAGGIDNATVTFTTDRDTLEGVLAADNPSREAVNALNRGDIRYEVTGLWNTVMYGVIGTLLRVFGGLI